MKKSVHAFFLALLFVSAPAVLADARGDLRVEKNKDAKGNFVLELVNIGNKNVKATLQHTKTCNSTTSNRDPIERDYWLRSKATQQLRKVPANSDCRHKYRVVKAEYY